MNMLWNLYKTGFETKVLGSLLDATPKKYRYTFIIQCTTLIFFWFVLPELLLPIIISLNWPGIEPVTVSLENGLCSFNFFRFKIDECFDKLTRQFWHPSDNKSVCCSCTFEITAAYKQTKNKNKTLRISNWLCQSLVNNCCTIKKHDARTTFF